MNKIVTTDAKTTSKINAFYENYLIFKKFETLSKLVLHAFKTVEYLQNMWLGINAFLLINSCVRVD